MKLQLRFPENNLLVINGIHCKECDTLLPPHARFCGVCGAKLDTNVRARASVSLLYRSTFVVVPVFAFLLWFLALGSINLGRMTNIGLVSVLPIQSILALAVLAASFCLSLNQKKLSEPVLLLHLLLLIFMLYGVTTLVEQQPRFNIVYQHAGFTEFIMRTGGVDPYLDAYFNWPGFFLLSAFLTKIAGYSDILRYATWAPVYFNIFYLGPMYVIFSTATRDKRIVWLGLCFFFLTNWIAQDYYSPQGLNFFLYLLLLAVLLKWFKNPVPASTKLQAFVRRRAGKLSRFVGPVYEWLTAPDDIPATPSQPRQRGVLLASVVIVFALMIFSHPLTPFLTIGSVAVLAIFGRITTRKLPILMAVMTIGWAVVMARPYLTGHIASILSDIGQIGRAISSNVTGRVTAGDPLHVFIGKIRTAMTLLIWLLAFAGAFFRLRRGYHDASYVLLAVTLFPIVLVQSYGGEMLLRIYLFTLPMMTFFAASLFYTLPPQFVVNTTQSVLQKLGRINEIIPVGTTAFLTKVLVTVVTVGLLVGFLFTRYGNERADYVTNAELTGVHQLYTIAPKNSLLLAGWYGTAWQSQDIERYEYYDLSEDYLITAVTTQNVDAVVQFIGKTKIPNTYLIFTRTQRATADGGGYPPGMLNKFERKLLASKQFVLVYQNPDAQILRFVGNKKTTSS